jgi:hypothetical protein
MKNLSEGASPYNRRGEVRKGLVPFRRTYLPDLSSQTLGYCESQEIAENRSKEAEKNHASKAIYRALAMPAQTG